MTEEIEARKWASERVPFHLHAPKALFGLVEGTSTKPLFFFEARAESTYVSCLRNEERYLQWRTVALHPK